MWSSLALVLGLDGLPEFGVDLRQGVFRGKHGNASSLLKRAWILSRRQLVQGAGFEMGVSPQASMASDIPSADSAS